MELTIFMTNQQANTFCGNTPFPPNYLDGSINAHYLEYSTSNQSWYWDGWDNTTSISRKHLPQLTYEEFISIPTPITLTKLKDHFPEIFI